MGIDSAKLGMRKPNLLLAKSNEDVETDLTMSSRALGEKRYELTNHLGNVLAVVSDKRLPNDEPDVVSVSDYYPYGMLMPDRNYDAEEYRYGFGGQEKESEMAEGMYSTEYRLSDTRLGLWKTPDPLFAKYPGLTSYNYCRNNPMIFIDPDGQIILGFKSGMSMHVSFLELGSGNLIPNYNLINGNNHVRSIYPENYRDFNNSSKIHFRFNTSIPDVVNYNSSSSVPLPKINSENKIEEKQQIRNRTGNAIGAAVEWVATGVASYINSSKRNQYLDIINADEAFRLAHNAVMASSDAITTKFNNINWTDEFRDAMNRGEIDIRNFKADIMNYMVDGNMNMDNFQMMGYPTDFNMYKNAVYQMGEIILESSNLNLNIPQQNTIVNNLKDTYIDIGK